MSECWLCGIELTDDLETPVVRCYCNKCNDYLHTVKKQEQEEYVRLKKKRMLDTALDKLENQGLDMYEYKEAINAVSEFLQENPDKFDSSEEVMAAIILCYNEINCIYQFKVLNYQCDICITDWKVIVEIDGDRHLPRREKDNYRDIEIISELGEEWNIIRIKAELIDTKAENLIKAIKAVMRKRIKDGRAVR